MKINYRIVRVDENEHSILVRYYTDIVTEEHLATPKTPSGGFETTPEGYPVSCRTDYYFNIWETPSPSQERIIEIIENGAPRDWLYLQEQILNANVDTSLSAAKQIEKIERSFDVEDPLPVSQPNTAV